MFTSTSEQHAISVLNHSSALNMEAACYSMSVNIYQTTSTWCYIQENIILHSRHYENVKCHSLIWDLQEQ